MIFDGFPGGPGAEQPWPDGGIWYGSWTPLSSSKQFPAAIQHAKYIMKHAGMKGYEKAGCKLRKYEKSRLQHALITTEEAGERSRKSPAAW